MAKRNSQEAINGLQNDSDYIVLNNPLSTPKFVRLMGRGKETIVNDTYTTKIFYEIVSRLIPEHLENIKRTETVKFEIQIKDFLESMGANIKNFKYLIDSVDNLQTTLLKWKEKNENFSVPIITKSIHNDKTGKIEIYVDSDLAKHILQIKQSENFSFLKSNIFRLQNAQAIRLYPFFKSWANYGKGYEIELERFKNDFGYSTSGYNRYGNIEKYILKPAIEEINEKTDMVVSYQTTGENLESQRPRVKGLIFYIKSKVEDKIQLPSGDPQPQEEQTHISNIIQAVIAPKQEALQPPKPPKKDTTQALIILKQEPPKPKEPPQQGAINEADLIVLSEKLKLTIEQYGKIKQRLKYDYIRIFEVLQGCLNEIKAGNKIKSNFAYILKGIDSLGVGMYAQEQEQAQKREFERIEKEKQALIEKIKQEYKDRKETQFLKLYENTTDQEKVDFFEYIKEKNTIKTSFGDKNYCITNGKLNKDGQATVGELLAEQKGTGRYGRQQKYKSEVLTKYGYQIRYDEHDQVIII